MVSEEYADATARKLGFWPLAGIVSIGALPIIVKELYFNSPGFGDELVALTGSAVLMTVYIQNMPQSGKSGGSNDGD